MTPNTDPYGNRINSPDFSNPWPCRGYAPGHYEGNCCECGRRHAADRHATRCIECAVRGEQDAQHSLREHLSHIDHILSGGLEVATVRAKGLRIQILVSTILNARKAVKAALDEHW